MKSKTRARSRRSMPARRAWAWVLALVLGLASWPEPAVAAAQPQPWTGKVVAVEDGATLEVMHAGHAERLRLAGVEPPELSQPWGRQAKEFAEQNALGQTVIVEPQGLDHKRRPLAAIILPDGRELGPEMIKEGLAWHYRRYSYNPLLGDLEKDARAEGRGLWSDPNPVPPWEWRARGGEAVNEPPPQEKKKRKRR